MRIAFDTNFIAYAEGFDNDARDADAERIFSALSGHDVILPIQVSAELMSVAVRKFRRDRADAAVIVTRWRQLSTAEPATTAEVLATAFDLAVEHRLQIFEAIILAASAEAGCRLLLSEDMQDGFVWRGTTVANPFAPTPHPLLADALRG